MYKFDNDTPIFIQLAKDIESQIISGKLKSGDKVSSVRELAKFYLVNPNTVQKAMSILENEGLIEVQRGVGRTISKTKNIETYKRKYILNEIREFSKKMKLHKIELDYILNTIQGGWNYGNK